MVKQQLQRSQSRFEARGKVFSGQSGFTLIELIVVIVILGILAATALPKFASLNSDARTANLNAARGAINAAAAMVYGKYLVGGQPATVTIQGTTVTIVNGYPAADANLATIAGLNAVDYTQILSGTAATANSPATSATQTAFIPVSVANSSSGLTCFVMYTAAAANGQPTVAVTSSGC